MVKNKKLIFPIFILLNTILITFIAFFLSDLLNIKNVYKVYEILKYFYCISLSLTGLLLIDVYKKSISSVWYWVYIVGLAICTFLSILSFAHIYITYFNSIVDKIYILVSYIKPIASVEVLQILRFERMYSVPIALAILVICLCIIYYIIINFDNRNILIKYIEEKENKCELYKRGYYKNISLGFLYNAIP